MAAKPAPEGVRAACRRGLDLHPEHGGAGLTSGAIARARAMASGKPVTDGQRARMRSFFARHSVDRKKDWANPPTPGYVSWLLWGGDAGKAFANTGDDAKDDASKAQREEPALTLDKAKTPKWKKRGWVGPGGAWETAKRRAKEQGKDDSYASAIYAKMVGHKSQDDGDIDMNKAEGEGSRGGHIIGHTKSGKPIYSGGHSSYAAMHEDSHKKNNDSWATVVGKYAQHAMDAHPSYTQQDHADAAELQEKRLGGPEHEEHIMPSNSHHYASELLKIGDKAFAANGDKKRPAIGKTQSGKPVYDHLHASNAGANIYDSHGAQGERRVASHPSFTKQDHLDASVLHERKANTEVRPNGSPTKAGFMHTQLSMEHYHASKLVKKSLAAGDAFEQLAHFTALNSAEDRMEKAEGSRGGHIIGHTKSGKPIYGTGHPAYSAEYKPKNYNGTSTPLGQAGQDGHKKMRQGLPEYSKQDHQDAADAHQAASDKAHNQWKSTISQHEKKHNLPVFRQGHAGGVEPAFGDKINDKIRSLNKEKHTHADAAKLHRNAMRLHNLGKSSANDAASVLEEMLRKGTSGALPTFDDKLDGDYLTDNPEPNGKLLGIASPNDGDARTSGNSEGDDGLPSTGEMTPKTKVSPNSGDARGEGDSKETSFGKDVPAIPEIEDWQDAKPAGWKPDALGKSGYTQQELQHEVARRQAVAKSAAAQAARGGPDVTMGIGLAGVPPEAPPLAKSRVVQQGLVTQVFGGADDVAAELVKGGDFWAQGRGPGLSLDGGPAQALCKSCQVQHPAYLTSCPCCGVGAVMSKSLRTEAAGQSVGHPIQQGPILQPAVQADVYAPVLNLNSGE